MRRAPFLTSCAFLLLAWAAPVHAARRFQATLTGAQQVPSAASTATGIGIVVLNEAETQITVNLTFSGLTGNPTGGHIHGAATTGVNAPILFDFGGVTPAATSGTIPEQTYAITSGQVTQLKAGQFYFNIHTPTFPGGEIRGQILNAPPERFRANLTGAQEVPPVASSGKGTGKVLLEGFVITVDLTFSDLLTNASAAHVHNAVAGATGPILFTPAGVPAATSGTVPTQTFSITTPQQAELKGDALYFNVHTTSLPDGEIRGQIGPAPVEAFNAVLSGAQESPDTSTPGTATASLLLNESEDELTLNLSFSGLTSNVTGAHIHGPALPGTNAPILFDLTSVTPAATSGSIPEQTFSLTPTQALQLETGQLYLNIHTSTFPGGEIRGQILQTPVRRFAASYSGSQVVPPNASAGSGTATLVLNGTKDQVTVNATFSGLTTNATGAHVHGSATTGVNAGVLFDQKGFAPATTGVVADQTYAITPAQVTTLEAGLMYADIDSGTYSGGEIRGQLGAMPLLTVGKGGTGTSNASVTSSPAGITCGGDCSEAYAAGTTVTLTPGAPAGSSVFTGWFGGGCSGTASCVVTLTADTNVTAVYTLASSSIQFTDDPLSPGTTPVQAVHILELRDAINSLRTSNSLGTFTFTDASLASGALVQAIHVSQLRTALDAVYTARSRTVPSYSDPTLTGGTSTVKALHVSELRQAVRLIE